MYNVQKFLIIGAGILCLFSCSKKPVAVERPSFSADSAYAYVERQMSFGPRVPNSDTHHRCAIWLMEQLRACGAQVELQKGLMPDFRGDNQAIYNIIGHFEPTAPTARPRILLGAHYDTRPWSDEEEVYADRFDPVPGANDGASGVGVLLEVARQLGLRRNDSTLRIPVDIIFFDCEDKGSPKLYTGPERDDTWCLGSQLWAKEYSQQPSVRYQYGIILDMVGAPDALFPMEYYSTQYAANYQQQIWQSATKLGYGAMFEKSLSYPITDDHYYINEIAGIPCVDIIHYDLRNASGFPAWWHTRNDNMSVISKSTLQAVGEVVMNQL